MKITKMTQFHPEPLRERGWNNKISQRKISWTNHHFMAFPNLLCFWYIERSRERDFQRSRNSRLALEYFPVAFPPGSLKFSWYIPFLRTAVWSSAPEELYIQQADSPASAKCIYFLITHFSKSFVWASSFFRTAANRKGVLEGGEGRYKRGVSHAASGLGQGPEGMLCPIPPGNPRDQVSAEDTKWAERLRAGNV